MPEPSIWQFLTAVTTTAMLVAIIFTPWGLVYGAPPVAVTLTLWFWPRTPPHERRLTEQPPLGIAGEART
jgi:cytochrome c oxidase subunit 1